MSQSKESPKMTPVPIFNQEQLTVLRKELQTSHGDTEHLTITLFERISHQLLIATDEVKRLQSENEILKTKLQVADVEIKKLKEKPVKK